MELDQVFQAQKAGLQTRSQIKSKGAESFPAPTTTTTPSTNSEKANKPYYARDGVLPGSWKDASADEVLLRKFGNVQLVSA